MMSSELLVDGLLAATGVVLVAWLASLVLRRAAAALRHSVWRVALIGIWLAPAVVVGGHLLHFQPCEVAVPVLRQASDVEPAASEAGVSREARLSPSADPKGPTGDSPLAAGYRPLRARAAARPGWRLGELLLGLWLTGTALGLAGLLRDTVTVRRLACDSAPVADPALRERIARWSAQIRLRTSPHAFASKAVTVPSVVGWRRPRLLLPAGGAQDDSSDDAAIVHELAHVRRADVAVHIAARLTRALWWWHPLVWLVIRELRRTAEEACDDWVVALTGERRGYAEVLVQWAEAAHAVGGMGCASRGNALAQRVRRILEGKQMPKVRLSWRARSALVLCAVAVIVGVGAVRLRAVAYGQEGEAEAAFRLEFYLATRVEDENVEVPQGWKLFEFRARHRDMRFLAEPEPVATDRDIWDTRLRESCHEEDGEQVWEPVVLFEFNEEAGARFRQVTGENVGSPMLIVLNGEVVMAPVIRSAIPGVGVIEGMTEEQLRAMAAHWKWDEPPEIAQGTGTIKVTARFADGARPEHAECTITTHSQSQQAEDAERARWLEVRPKVVGADGDWTVFNATPGEWSIQLRGGNFPDTEFKVVRVEKPGEQVAVNLTLAPGGTVIGRVVSAETGEPVHGADVSWVGALPGAHGRRGGSARTDAEGRYTISHALAGRGSLWAFKGWHFAARQTEELQLGDGGTITAPDIKLVRGGSVSGRVVLPQDVPQDMRLRGWIWPVAEGEPPAGTWLRGANVEDDGTFHLALVPLPPGSYTLEATLEAGPMKSPAARWQGKVEGIRVEVGEETEGVVIRVTRTEDE